MLFEEVFTQLVTRKQFPNTDLYTFISNPTHVNVDQQ